jgi:hypothetical protein
MRIRDLIEHNVKTKHSGFNRAKLRSLTGDDEDEEENEIPVLDLGVFDSPSLDPTPDTKDATTPGATATGLQAPKPPTFE